MKVKNKTSWGGVAKWYDKHLDGDDTYHAQVIAPNLMRIVDVQPGESLLEIGCGQGYFLEKFAAAMGGRSGKIAGVDIGKELIKIAKAKKLPVEFSVGNAEDPKLLTGQKFDTIMIVLALQNMKNLPAVMTNLSRLLAPKGRVVLVLNHPAFRIPQYSDWGFDEAKGVQYRRVDRYMTDTEITIDMNPGSKKSKEMTASFHRPLQVYMKAFAREKFAITKIEEWISHKTSEKGPRQSAEDAARKEIPMFMCMVLQKVA